MNTTVRYQIIGKAYVERGGDCANAHQYALKLLYQGDGTPWWTCTAGLELIVPEDFYATSQVGQFVELNVRVVQP